MKGEQIWFFVLYLFPLKGGGKECFEKNKRTEIQKIKIVDSLLKNYQLFDPSSTSPNSFNCTIHQKPHWDCGGLFFVAYSFILQIISFIPIFFVLSSNEVVSTENKLFFLPPKKNEWKNFPQFFFLNDFSFPQLFMIFFFFYFISEICL